MGQGKDLHLQVFYSNALRKVKSGPYVHILARTNSTHFFANFSGSQLER
jgi:hypothetical protein